jgi:hypothetical protein
MNYIVPTREGILLIASPQDENSLFPMIYQHKGEAKMLHGWDKDLTVGKLYANPRTGEVIVSAYSNSESWKRIDEDSEKYPFEEAPESIYTILGKDKPGTRRFDADRNVVALAQTKDETVCVTSNYEFATRGLDVDEITDLDESVFKDEYMSVNNENGRRSVYEAGEKLGKIEDLVYITKDSRYIFFIRRGERAANELCRYDASKDETETIYSAKYGENELNNAIILPY